MKIGIIETGEVPAALQARHGTYPDMFRRLVGEGLPGADTFVHSLLDGQGPPDPRAADGWVITGSAYGVYDPVPWIEPLKGFIRRAGEAGVPQVGICFGHQIMAEAFGGRVVKSEKGWGCGLHSYEVLRPQSWMTPELPRVRVAAMHQDQVVELPEAAEVVGGSNFCPFGILAYPGARAMSFQVHPEFEADYTADLIRSRAGTRISHPVADVGLHSLGGESDRGAVALWIGRFLKDGV
ncbi:MAG: type 1 glutamine amidotransferase [Alphaproteobacteria bacterium]|nr:type 1 glutamine amidotransferase [Alphaproteobacteria bacterium]MDX5369199.1 type 1 glutamine amidotransferase [Alphaproteobacteria bacterium]MDX5463895.1 type 1 glutamine amidotransferase [Alphaproteobacteria bacterium]